MIYTAVDSLSGGAPDEDNLNIMMSLVDGWIVKLDFLAQITAIPTATTVLIGGIGFESNPNITQEFDYGGADYFDLFEDFVSGTLDALVVHGSLRTMPVFCFLFNDAWTADTAIRIQKNFRFPIRSRDMMRFKAFISELAGNDTLTAINYTAEMTQVVKPTRW